MLSFKSEKFDLLIRKISLNLLVSISKTLITKINIIKHIKIELDKKKKIQDNQD